MENKLDSYHLPVTGRNILRFAFPTIVMTVFNTFYTMVDGLFVSNLIGMEALSAINLTAPAVALITAVSGMLAAGGSAVVMKKMGEHKETEARPDSPVYELAVTGNRLCSLALLFVGMNVFASGMFTALSNGAASAVLAFSRSFLFTAAGIQIMPVLLGGVTGVWLATPAAELLGTAMAAAELLRYRKRYGY